MAYIIAFISISILGAIIFFLLISKLSTTLEKLLLAAYSINLLTEACMMITSRLSISNHFIANIHSLVFGVLMLLILSQISQRLVKQRATLAILLVGVGFDCIVWVLDNWVVHSIAVFNPISQSIIFSVDLIFSIYLLSLILFIEDTPLRKNVNSMFVIGFLVYAANNVIIDFFFNYYMHLPDQTYIVISEIGIGATIASHFLVLIGVVWLTRRRKYMLGLFR